MGVGQNEIRTNFKGKLNLEFKRYLLYMDKKNKWEEFVLPETILIHFGLWLANRNGKPEKFVKGDKV